MYIYLLGKVLLYISISIYLKLFFAKIPSTFQLLTIFTIKTSLQMFDVSLQHIRTYIYWEVIVLTSSIHLNPYSILHILHIHIHTIYIYIYIYIYYIIYTYIYILYIYILHYIAYTYRQIDKTKSSDKTKNNQIKDSKYYLQDTPNNHRSSFSFGRPSFINS